MSMKAVGPAVLRQFGFRWTLTVNAIVSAAFIAACAGFRPGTPVVVMMAVLVIGGFFRSLEFTSINTIAYAEIDKRRMSRATSLVSVAQQLRCRPGSRSARWRLSSLCGFPPRRHQCREFPARFPVGRRAVGLGGLRLYRARAGCRCRTRHGTPGRRRRSADGLRPVCGAARPGGRRSLVRRTSPKLLQKQYFQAVCRMG